MKPLLFTITLLLIFSSVGLTNDDYEGSYKMYLENAQKGDIDAMFFLGSMFQAGDEIRQDLNEAKKWYLMAAKRGNFDAMWALNTFEGNVASKVERCAWCIIAAEQGVTPAKGRLPKYLNTKYLTLQEQEEAKKLAENYKAEIKAGGYAYKGSL